MKVLSHVIQTQLIKCISEAEKSTSDESGQMQKSLQCVDIAPSAASTRQRTPGRGTSQKSTPTRVHLEGHHTIHRVLIESAGQGG